MAEQPVEKVFGNFEEAEDADALTSKFFKAKTNIPYKLTFAPVEPSLQGQPPVGYRLIQKKIPDFNDKTKLVDKVILQLRIDSVNGTPVDQIWDVLQWKLRVQLQSACTTGNILRKVYLYKSIGEGKDKVHTIAESADRPVKPVAPVAPAK